MCVLAKWRVAADAQESTGALWVVPSQVCLDTSSAALLFFSSHLLISFPSSVSLRPAVQTANQVYRAVSVHHVVGLCLMVSFENYNQIRLFVSGRCSSATNLEMRKCSSYSSHFIYSFLLKMLLEVINLDIFFMPVPIFDAM